MRGGFFTVSGVAAAIFVIVMSTPSFGQDVELPLVIPAGQRVVEAGVVMSDVDIAGELVAAPGDALDLRGNIVLRDGGLLEPGTFNPWTQENDLPLRATLGLAESILIEGGTLNHPGLWINYSSDKPLVDIRQTGGLADVDNLVVRSAFAETAGGYALEGGTARIDNLIIGSEGEGSGWFEQTGGQAEVDSFFVSHENPDAAAEARLLGGAFQTQSIGVGIPVELVGVGDSTLTIGGDAQVTTGSLEISRGGVLTAQPGSTIHFEGDESYFTHYSKETEGLDTWADLTLDFADDATLEVLGRDRHSAGEAVPQDVLIGQIVIGEGATLTLVDAFDHWGDGEADALYVDTVVLGANATLDLNGVNLYAANFDNQGGQVVGLPLVIDTINPEPATAALTSLGAAALLTRRPPRRCLAE